MLPQILRLFLLVAFLQAGSAFAQHHSAAPAGPTEPVVNVAAARSDFDTALANFSSAAAGVHSRFRSLVANFSTTAQGFRDAIAAAGPDGDAGWVLPAWLTAIALVAAGLVVAILAGRLMSPWLRRFPEMPPDRATKVGYLGTAGGTGIAQAVVLLVTGILLNDLINPDTDPAHDVGIVALLAASGAGIVFAIVHSIIMPWRPAYRMPALNDAEARGFWRDATITAVLSTTTIAVAVWIRGLPVPADGFLIAYIVQVTISMLLLAGLVLRQRRTVCRAILGHHPEHAGGLRHFIASSWHVWVCLYLVAAWIVSIVRGLLGTGHYIGLLTAPVLIIAIAFGLYGILLVVMEVVFRGQPADEMVHGKPLPSYRRLAEETGAIAIMVIALGAVFHLWGVSPFAVGGSVGMRLFTEVLIVFGGYLAYQTTKIAIDRYLAREMAKEDPHAAHGSSSRLATLLHLFRGFALISIIIMAVMVGLSDLGINIAPLFAGAGVIGLAVGFGSQTLIKDIFSGAFFLIDDAFRRGEYIDIGSAKGNVERISIRSLQLRHQNGPLYTIPFGNIHQISNFSRDWVIMKLPLRLAYGTDPEVFRKIVKKIAEEFANDPENGPKFLEPLKSQGVYEMDDSGMTFRVKFMTRPGDNFVLRRMIYQRLQDKLHAAGIQFAANRSMTVRVETANGTIDATTGTQAAMAALPMLTAASGPDDGDDDAADAR